MEKPGRSSPATGWCIAVPADSDRVELVDDLAGRGVKLAVGAESVPVGAYTREVLARLPAGEEKAILANVRSNEPDVKGVVGKLTQGAADAGFVYITDVVATDGKVKAIELPKRPAAERRVRRGGGQGSEEPEAARDVHRRPASTARAAEALRRRGVRAAAAMSRGAALHARSWWPRSPWCWRS